MTNPNHSLNSERHPAFYKYIYQFKIMQGIRIDAQLRVSITHHS